MSSATESVVNMSSSTTETPTEPVAYSTTETLSNLIGIVEAQQSSMRDLQRQLKRLEKEVIKEHKRLSKVNKPKRIIVQKPTKVSKSMTKFMKKMNVPEHESGGWTRQAMMKAVSSYVKTKDLQLKESRKNWKPDSTLAKLFSLESDSVYSFININGLISRVVEK